MRYVISLTLVTASNCTHALLVEQRHLKSKRTLPSFNAKHCAQNSTGQRLNRDDGKAAEDDFNGFPDVESPDAESGLESCAPGSTSEALSTSFHFVNKSLCDVIVSNFRQQRMDGQFLDVTLKVDDTTIVAHRAFLAAFSRYFATLFGSGMMESDVNELTLRDVDGAALSLLIDYAYSAELDITVDNVLKLLQTADYLGIDVVCDVCSEFIHHRLVIANVFDVMALASTFHYAKLYARARVFAVERFEQLAQRTTFFDIDPNLLRELVSDDRLVFTEDGYCVGSSRQEQRVLESVLRYVGHDELNRLDLLSSFLSSAVRLSFIPPELIRRTRDNFVAHPKTVAVLDDAICDARLSQQETRRSMKGLTYELSPVLADRHIDLTANHYEEYDDSKAPSTEARYVTGMKVLVRLWYDRPIIGGLEITYSSGQVASLGFENVSLGETHEFRMESNERIVSVSVKANWMIDQLTFYSSYKRQFGPYGGSGGSEHRFDRSSRPGTYLAGIRCHIENTRGLSCMRHLGLVWACYKYDAQW